MITIGVVGWLPVQDMVQAVLGGNVPVPVTHAKDTSAGRTGHILTGDVVELPAPMDHFGGASAGRHLLATTVLHKGQSLTQDGHDQGPQLPHGPVGGTYAVARSNRKNSFAASKVVFQSKPAACIHGMFWPMMACGDPFTLPDTQVFSNSTHTVFVGMTHRDVVRGIMGIGASVATDLLTRPNSADDVVEGVATGKEPSGVDPKKLAIQAAMNFAASMVISDYSGWEEPIGTKVEISNPAFQKSLEISYDPVTKAWEGKGAQNELSEKKSFTVKYEPGKDVETKYEETPGHFSDASKKLGEWL
jgi:hypothetical protein